MFSNSHNLVNDPTTYVCAKSFLSTEEIEKICEYVKKLPRMNGTVNLGDMDGTARKSIIRWITNKPEIQWLNQKILNLVDEANEKNWKFNIYSQLEAIQYTEYHDDGGHYDYHLDIGGNYPLNQRKISITIQLSDSSEYEGGNFEILRGYDPEVLEKEKGTAILFPSFLLHRVTPVTKGIRKSLVLWIGGGSFK